MSCENLTFSELYTAEYDLTDLFAMSQRWCTGAVYHQEIPRKRNAVIYLDHCSGQYTDCYNRTFYAPAQSLVCLPQGSRYRVLNLTCDSASPDAYLIEFNIVQNGQLCTFGDSPFPICDVSGTVAGEYAKAVAHAYESPVRSPAAVKAAVYRLLAFLGNEMKHAYSRKYAVIAPGISFLEENALSDLSIENIAHLCHVSPACFRRLFKEYSGKSPLQYRLDLKIEMAKKMLEYGDLPLEDVAYSLNLENAAYFCKLFKRKTGLTPGEYRKKQNKRRN